VNHTTTEMTATFSTDATDLPAVTRTDVVDLDDGDTYELRIAPVAKTIGDDRVRMLAYNGSIPGPTLRVRQGSELVVHVRNDGDTEATVHWHGLRLDNAYDGVPFETQPPIAVGGEFTYRLRFPDPGLYWYHPHIREDYGLDMGLYGNIVVEPTDDGYWPAVDREVVVTLDDVLVEDGRIAAFHEGGPTHVAMGRFGNVMLTGGETSLALTAHVGEVVRLYFTNTANTRLFDVALPGARMKLVGADSGRYEHETFVDDVLLAPSERAIVDVRFDRPGSTPIEHRTPDRTYTLGTVDVTDTATTSSSTRAFEELRTSDELTGWRARLDDHAARRPDKALAFTSRMPLLYGDGEATAAAYTCPMHPEVVSTEPATCPRCGMRLVPASSANGDAPEHEHAHAHDMPDGLEWEDLMPEINAASNAHNMLWRLVDVDTGKQNWDIDWAFLVGDLVKIRLLNDMDQDHPMHHPFHIHGAGRFLVVARDDVVEPNLAWKDTVLVRSGETVDILLDVTNPGLWMAHCHIAEHNQAGMMFSFPVRES
jgi:FtsP/CotA-like multicopper oxidase with cupredoxin domain